MKKVSDYSTKSRILFLLTKGSGIILSIILLLTVVYLLLNKNSNKSETSSILIAKKDIPPKQTITADMLSLQDYVKGYVPRNSISSDKAENVLGKKVLFGIQKGDVIVPSMFGAVNGNLSGGIANVIPADKKLVYIKSDDLHVIPNDIQKDNKVDIISINQKAETNNTDVVAEKITVFDIVRSNEDGKNVITSIGILMSNQEILKLSSKFTQDWKLSLSVRPQKEPATNTSLLETASSEGKLNQPSNEKTPTKTQ